MKKFICGFVAGAMLFGAVGAFAVSYIANPAGFKVLVNGEEFVSDPPALEVEGRTYLPLRAMGDALGVPVTWNEELGQAEVGNSAPVVDENQYSRNNPAPINTVQTYVSKNPNEYIDMSSIRPDHTVAIRVIDVTRGEEALKIIKDANQFNSEPSDGYEYIIAKVAFSVLDVQNDTSINANEYNFDFYSGNNEEYDKPFVTMDGKLSTNLYTGGNAEGYVVGMVKKDDANPKLVYGLIAGQESYGKSVWFALN